MPLLLGLVSSCSENYVIPDIQIVEYDSLVWMHPLDSQKIDKYFVLDGEVYCGGVAYNEYPLKGVDLETFEVFTSTGYARDKNSVYYPISEICVDGEDWGNCHCVEYRIENSHPKSFKYFDYGFAKDKNQVYYAGNILSNVNPENFEYLSGGFAVTPYKVFWVHYTIPEANPSTFKVLGEGYATDSFNIFYLNKIVEKADPLSFQVTGFGEAKDSSNKYFYGTIVENGS